MGTIAARDLAVALGVVEHAVEAQRGAQMKLQAAAASEDDEEVLHLATTLRGAIAENRRAQRDGARAQQTARSQINTTSFQISQAIAADRNHAGARPNSPRRESAERASQVTREPSPRRTQRVR